jgi:hypothetical protein
MFRYVYDVENTEMQMLGPYIRNDAPLPDSPRRDAV